MGFFSWIIGGLIVGAVARLLVKGPSSLGCLGTSVLGMLGSIIGGTLYSALNGNGLELQASGFLGSIAGAVLLLVLARLVGSGRRPPRRFEDELDRRR